MRVPGRGWAYLGALLGGAVSIAANVAHSYVPPAEIAKAIETARRVGIKAPEWSPPFGAVVGAVFWPIALFVAIEILARVPWPAGNRWVAVRYLGLLPVAAVAAVVSYRHLSGLLDFYGEDSLTVVIGPLAVDGLMVMATGALIATSRTRIPVVEIEESQEPAPTPEPAPEQPAGEQVEDAEPDTRNEASPKPTPATAKVARARRRYPDLTQQEIATKTDLSVTTVKRQWPLTAPEDTAPANGRVPELASRTTD